MEFREIAEKLGFEKYPEALDEIYASMSEDNTPACDLALIDKLEQDMEMFGRYYQLVRRTAEQINNDPLRSVWVKVAAKFALESTSKIAKTIPSPRSDGTEVTDMLPLHIMIPQLPGAIEEYYRRGFSYEEVKGLMKDFEDSIGILEKLWGRPCINALYFGWLHHYTKVEIFITGGYWFELTTVKPNAMWLRNRQTGEIVCVPCRGTFDPTGSQVVGSMNYEDPTGSFTVSVTEDDEKFVGHGIYDHKVSPVAIEYPKSQWECAARPGDKCLELHIPRNGSIALDVFDKAVASAREIAKTRFPEKAGMPLHGSSWLLDPKVAEVLGPDSRLSMFMERFIRYPQRSRGDGVFGYVFPKVFKDYESLPEDTSLQRKLKKLYMDGDCVHGQAGMVF